MRILIAELFFAIPLALAAGCASTANVGNAQTVQCPYASVTPVIDGKLDDPIWKTAPSYDLRLTKDAIDMSGNPSNPSSCEAGKFQIAYDKENFYLAVKFTDSDIVAKGTADGQLHYKYGDLAELFLWPESQTWYWELYVTPKSMQTSFFYPGGGRTTLDEHLKNAFQFQAKAVVDGTLDDWTDRDSGWAAEMAIPVSELVRRGGNWGPGSKWRILVSRYNFSRWIQRPELSSHPVFPKANFHLKGCYATIEFQEGDQK